LESADIVQVESPWPFAFARARTKAPIVFVAHNVECDLHEAALVAHGGRELLARSADIEGRAFRDADLVLCFGQEDLDRLEERYGPRDGPTLATPIGADVRQRQAADPEQRLRARTRLGVPEDSCVALFAGSAHGPNLDAARFLQDLAERLSSSGIFVVLAGSVRPRAEAFPGGLATGPLASLAEVYAAADLATNPMATGSGMNQKVAEYLAHGLPVVSTPFGARGFTADETRGILLVDRDQFAARLRELGQDPQQRQSLARRARDYALAELDWERIAARRLEAIEALTARERGS
jgi:glycosyltransferase involved in cell wall biosynthesis